MRVKLLAPNADEFYEGRATTKCSYLSPVRKTTIQFLAYMMQTKRSLGRERQISFKYSNFTVLEVYERAVYSLQTRTDRRFHYNKHTNSSFLLFPNGGIKFYKSWGRTFSFVTHTHTHTGRSVCEIFHFKFSIPEFPECKFVLR